MKKMATLTLAVTLIMAGCHNPPHPPTPPDPPTPPTPPTPPKGFVQANGPKLVIDGAPWRMTLDTAWWINEKIGSDANAVAYYLDTRKSQGFNTIMWGCGGDWFNKSVSNPKEPILSRMDAVLNQLEARGMFAVPVIQIHQYVDGKPILVLPIGEAEAFGKYFANRYKDRKCIAFWLVGGLDDKGVVPNSAIMSQAVGLKSIDAIHLVSFHPRANYTTLAAFPAGSNHQLALYQSYHTYDAGSLNQRMTEAKNSGMPYANIEGPFDEEGNIGAPEIGKVMSVCSKYDAFGTAYGNNYVWQFSNWKNHLSSKGLSEFLKYK
jgi:hypothetical protein